MQEKESNKGCAKRREVQREREAKEGTRHDWGGSRKCEGIKENYKTIKKDMAFRERPMIDTKN